MKKYLWPSLVIMFPMALLAHPLTSAIRPHSGFNQTVTQNTCSIFSDRRDSVLCNPANLASSASQGMVFSLLTKTDGDSVEAGQEILFNPITKEFLQDLFELNSFNTWDANSMIEFRTNFFYLSYEPIYAQAAFFIFNPASPEISMTTSSQRRINLTFAHELAMGDNKFHFGLNTFYFAYSDTTGHRFRY